MAAALGRLPMRISHNMRKTHKEATKHRWKHGEYVDRHRERGRGRETLLSRVAIYVKDRLPPSAGRRRRALSPLSLAKLDTDGPTSSVRTSSVPQKGRFTSTHSLTDSLTLHRGRLAAEEEGRPGGGRINSARTQSDPLSSLRPTGARRPRSTTWMPLLFPSPLAAWLQN